MQKKRKPRELTRVWRNRLGNRPASVTNAVGTLMIEQAPSSQKEKVVSARRIWGTTKTTTVATVTSALTSVGDKLVIRHKFKTTTGNRIRWWLVVRGSEEDLCNLQNEWDCINFQTSWKLEAHRESSPSRPRPSQR